MNHNQIESLQNIQDSSGAENSVSILQQNSIFRKNRFLSTKEPELSNQILQDDDPSFSQIVFEKNDSLSMEEEKERKITSSNLQLPNDATNAQLSPDIQSNMVLSQIKSNSNINNFKQNNNLVQNNQIRNSNRIKTNGPQGIASKTYVQTFQKQKIQQQAMRDLKQKDEENKTKFKNYLVEQRMKTKFLILFKDTESQRFKNMRQCNFDKIKDKCFFLEGLNKKKIKIQSFSKQRNVLSKNIKLIKVGCKQFLQKKALHPQSIIAIFNDIISLFLTLYWIFMFSIHIFFQYNHHEQPMVYFMVMTIIFYIYEFIMKMNTSYYFQGMLIYDRKKIFQKYKQETIFSDILGLFSTAYHLIDIVLEREQILSKIRYLDYDDGSTWLQQQGLENETIYIKYLESFYFAAATVMLIGSKGDTFFEILFVTCTLLLTVGVFAYVLSSISQIIQDYDKEKTQYKRDLGVINKYMTSKKLDPQIQSRAQNFLEYQYKASKKTSTNIQAETVMLKLPKYFREEINQIINKRQFEKFNFLSSIFSKKTQDELLQSMEEQQYIMNETIFKQDQNTDIHLFYIQQGKIDLYYQKADEKQKFTFLTLKQGDFIGDINFITGQQYEYTAICSEFATTCKIKRDNFMQIIQENQEDLQKYHQLKDQYLLTRYSNLYNRFCKICNRNTHIEEDCNQQQYRPNKGLIYLKSQQSQFMERKNFERRQRQKGILQEALDGALMDYLFIISEKIEDDLSFQPYIEELNDYAFKENINQSSEESNQSSEESDDIFSVQTNTNNNNQMNQADTKTEYLQSIEGKQQSGFLNEINEIEDIGSQTSIIIQKDKRNTLQNDNNIQHKNNSILINSNINTVSAINNSVSKHNSISHSANNNNNQLNIQGDFNSDIQQKQSPKQQQYQQQQIGSGSASGQESKLVLSNFNSAKHIQTSYVANNQKQSNLQQKMRTTSRRLSAMQHIKTSFSNKNSIISNNFNSKNHQDQQHKQHKSMVFQSEQQPRSSISRKSLHINMTKNHFNNQQNLGQQSQYTKEYTQQGTHKQRKKVKCNCRQQQRENTFKSNQLIMIPDQNQSNKYSQQSIYEYTNNTNPLLQDYIQMNGQNKQIDLFIEFDQYYNWNYYFASYNLDVLIKKYKDYQKQQTEKINSKKDELKSTLLNPKINKSQTERISIFTGNKLTYTRIITEHKKSIDKTNQ